MLPAGYLAARTVAVRLAFWTDVLTERPGRLNFFACREEGSVCGFASGGPGPLGGELYSAYLLEGAQGLGLGLRLLEAVLGTLGGRAVAWVLEENPARGVYEHLGGRRRAEKRVEKGGETLTEAAYKLGPF